MLTRVGRQAGKDKDLGLDLSDSDDEKMAAGMMMRRSEYQDDLDPVFPFRMSDSVLNATTTQKSSPVAVAGPNQFSNEMFAPLRPQHQFSSSC